MGNDIVDLQLARKQSNWRRRGWLQKIYTNAEQKYILASKTPEILVWKFWSMKEATYKAHQRRFMLSPTFNPKDFECLPDDHVLVDNHIYNLQTEITTNYVYSVAKTSGTKCCSNIYDGEIDIKDNLKRLIAEELNISTSIAIQKDVNRIPMAYINKKEGNIQFSITHHGRYSAIVLVTK
ncbi:4'-phosphopantetheinyl transferase family protein [Aquimarina sp. 2304DJ70-9]|uniref:4'-phosphopantetheinyl transferase family protein n=1 Tax=Aquimarina penaris TaxID=3231044 RepID=UPI003462504A